MPLPPRARPLIACLLACGLGLVGPVGRALADGDPASDVLVTSPVFLAADSGASVAQEAELIGQLRRARLAGHPLRVAVISTSADLGSIGALWRRPQAYAQFLGRELSLVYHGELLVVMPDGFGVSRGGAGVRTGLVGLAPRPGDLDAASTQAVARLTGVAARRPGAVAVVTAPSSTSGLGWWLPTGIGAALLAGVWVLSVRRMPLRRRRRAVTAGDSHG